MSRNKLKVSTKPSNARINEERILKIVRDSPEGTTPKYLSSITRINQNTVKSILGRLFIAGRITKSPKIRGNYLTVEKSTHEVLFYNLHNVILRFKSDRINIDNRIQEINSLNELIKFRLEIGKKSRQATMTISSDYPFNVTALSILGHIFQEKLQRHCSITPSFEEIEIVTMEINKDYWGFKMEGANLIMLSTLIADFKLYQKKNRVREEFKIKIPVGFDLITKMLQQGVVSTEVNLRLSKQEESMSNLQSRTHALERGHRTLISRLFNNKNKKR